MSRFDTCFFERYARISLETLLDKSFAELLNKDRPDLQSPDGVTLGIEVTRAMPESKEAAESLLKGMAGAVPAAETAEEQEDLDDILSYGYGYGLQDGRYIGTKEYSYWSMALPMRRIIESKVRKAGDGFYGSFKDLDLYVFCNDRLSGIEVMDILRYTMSLQENQTTKYGCLYLSEINGLNVCNLADGISDAYRTAVYPIPRELRKEFFFKALQTI